jgi:HK97 gp10 family phage protein
VPINFDQAVVVEILPDFRGFRAAVQAGAKDLSKTTGMRVQIHEGNLRRFMEDSYGPLMRHTERVADMVQQEVRRQAPIDTGRLRLSVKMVKGATGQKFGWSVAADTHYAVFVEKGTRPHVIMPKRAKVLKFTARDGNEVYARKVNHPGTRPQPFMERALRRVVR